MCIRFFRRNIISMTHLQTQDSLVYRLSGKKNIYLLKRESGKVWKWDEVERWSIMLSHGSTLTNTKLISKWLFSHKISTANALVSRSTLFFSWHFSLCTWKPNFMRESRTISINAINFIKHIGGMNVGEFQIWIRSSSCNFQVFIFYLQVRMIGEYNCIVYLPFKWKSVQTIKVCGCES